MRHLLAPAALALLAALPAAAGAQNLVTNPGFETFGPTPQIVPGYTFMNNGIIAGAEQTADPSVARAGTGAFLFEGFRPSESATLSQTLATTAGTTYRVGFFAFNAAAPDAENRLTVTFGGQTVFDQAITSGAYQEFSGLAVATGGSAVLAFTGYNAQFGTFIDDLSVTAVPASTVPEPATWALVGAGLAGVAAAARRRTA